MTYDRQSDRFARIFDMGTNTTYLMLYEDIAHYPPAS
jgi:hypothetical protein